ncbi:Ricin-type beta-trefoil lectin domain-like [Eubacterium aggregans]|uniref:Ricin-type beta-trefoil lectin domain-like n=1 Tax=Eubacterium aggregans TaxID=81409 RepID=A0A1H4D469_9FIRM|nr:RICIN domain-containing protein [Eubacterium aggregans]SEA67391.1 Ricin-type beta-trefoil lectin domain-like [Eubacterium aggregans]
MVKKLSFFRKDSYFLLMFVIIGFSLLFSNIVFAEGVSSTIDQDIEQSGMIYTIMQKADGEKKGQVRLISVSEEASYSNYSYIIPSELVLDDGSEYAVTAISKDAFLHVRELRNIVIPDSVLLFEKGCFNIDEDSIRDENISTTEPINFYANVGSNAEKFVKENGFKLVTEGIQFEEVESFSLDKDEKSIITVKVPEFFNQDERVKWTTENKDIVSIDDNGCVSGITSGQTRIWAECEGLKSSLKIEVKEKNSESEVSTMVLENATSYSGIKDGGIYSIVSALNGNMVMDVYAANKDNGANVQLWSYNGTDAQRFKAQKNNDETWTFINVNSGKAMDLASNENLNGANIQQYSLNGTNAQKWKVIDNGDETVTFLNSNGKVIDVYGALTFAGTNIQLYQNNGTKAQRFILRQSDSYSGIYTFKSTLNQNKVVDVAAGSVDSGANIQLYDSNNTNAQKFNVESVGSNYYKITNMKSGKVLDVVSAGKENGTNIQQYEWNGTVAQKWRIQDNVDGSVTFISACNSLAMDICYGYTNNGANVWCYQSNGSKAQKWIMEPVSYTPDYSITAGSTGVDVSYWNGYNNNWNSAKNAGVQFAILRTGWGRSGDGEKDSTFEGNYSRATAAGLPIGTYQYSYATSVAEAKAEAQFVLSILNGRALDLPVAFDIEDGSQSGLSKTELTNITIAFCDTIKAGGYTPMVYANLNWFTNKLDYDRLSSYKIWLAQYNDQPTFNKSFDIWQYSSKGQIPGLGGLIDMNRAYKNL